MEEASESGGGAREVARAVELDRGVEIEPVGRRRAGRCVDREEEEDDDDEEVGGERPREAVAAGRRRGRCHRRSLNPF